MLRSILISGLVTLIIASTAWATDPVCPGFLRTVEVNGPSLFTGIDIEGDLAVTADNLGLSTWDLSDPEQPERLGSYVYGRGYYYSLWEPTDVFLHPSKRWACLLPSFDCFDLREPSRPEPFKWQTDEWPDDKYPSNQLGIAFDERLLAARNGYSGIWLLDYTKPGPLQWLKPSVLQDTFILVTALALVEDHLLVIDGAYRKCFVFSVRDPANPTFVSSLPLDESTITYWAYRSGIPEFIAGTDFAVAFNRDGIYFVIDLTDPAAPSFETSPESGLFPSLSFDLDVNKTSAASLWFDLDVNKTSAVAVSEIGTSDGPQWRVLRLDYSDPSTPVICADAEVERASWAAVSQERTVTANYSFYSTNLSVHHNNDLSIVGESINEGVANVMAAADGVGVLANLGGGIVTYDLSDPANPVEISRFEDVMALRIDLRNTTAIVTSSHSDTVKTIDVKDPGTLKVLDTIHIDGLSSDFEVSEGLAAVATWFSDLGDPVHLIDWSDPHNLRLRSSFNPADYQNPSIDQLRIQGDNLFVLYDRYSPFVSVDVSNPDEPVVLDSLQTGGYDFDILDDIALLGYSRGVSVVSIENPNELVFEQNIESVRASRIERLENGLFAYAGYDKGLADFSDLDNPVVYEEPQYSRSYDAGVIIDNTWLRPSDHVIDVVSLECRPPEAEIRTAGRGPTIWFEDLSRYQVTERAWDFGDGETSDELNPVHTYASPGDYTVTLTVSSPNGSDTVSQILEVGPARVRGGSQRR